MVGSMQKAKNYAVSVMDFSQFRDGNVARVNGLRDNAEIYIAEFDRLKDARECARKLNAITGVAIDIMVASRKSHKAMKY